MATTTSTTPAGNLDTVEQARASTWQSFSGNGPAPQARILGFSSPMQNAAQRVVFPWERPGDPIGFEMTVEVQGDPTKVKAELWTNANNNDAPDRYRAIPMSVARVDGSKVTYRAEVPIEHIGNYRAAARLSVDGGATYQWAGGAGLKDISFRPRAESHDRLAIEEVNVGNANFDPATGRLGTFADLMDSGSPETNGKLTLEWLAAQGRTALWLQPPFEVSHVGAKPSDDAASPYAVKDFFSIRTEFSRDAQGLVGEAAQQAALQEFKAFVDKAHSLGLQVILDVPLNHVGWQHQFRDLFVRTDAAGREIREVRPNDFSQVASPEQLAVIEQRLADPGLPKYMEAIAPWMYGSAYRDPGGARDSTEVIPAGWGEWTDAAQLNHGRERTGYSAWGDMQSSPEHERVQGWL
ncbi:MAG: hypothetical protein HY901_04945, partial [Deltaproteobacteria bacterium]|nr:hypothetical protein [Deltaproteobacteria bacterium]